MSISNGKTGLSGETFSAAAGLAISSSELPHGLSRGPLLIEEGDPELPPELRPLSPVPQGAGDPSG